MAMVMFGSMVEQLDERWEVDSAGTWAIPGERATRKARRSMEELGLDLSDHRSRPVDEELLRSYALILTMEKGQKEGINIEFPQFKKKVYLLSEMVGENHEIRDPIGGSMDDFRETVAELDRILMGGFEEISKLAGDPE
jgi:protein-tyrosine-phosphatase